MTALRQLSAIGEKRYEFNTFGVCARMLRTALRGEHALTELAGQSKVAAIVSRDLDMARKVNITRPN